MTTIARVSLLVLAVTLWAASGRAQQASTGPLSNDEIKKILAERVDTHRQSVGIVVGVVEPAGRRIVTYGRASSSEAVPLNGDTIFEIGSMSKVFTSLLLADAVRRGEVALADPISKYLPPVAADL